MMIRNAKPIKTKKFIETPYKIDWMLLYERNVLLVKARNMNSANVKNMIVNEPQSNLLRVCSFDEPANVSKSLTSPD